MRAALIVTTKGGKTESQFFEQASEGKRAFRSLKGDFDSARYWELSRPQKRYKKKAEKPAPVENRPFHGEQKEAPAKKAAKKAEKKPTKTETALS